MRTSSTAMLGGTNDPVVRSVRERISRFSGYAENLLEPLQVVKYQQGQKYGLGFGLTLILTLTLTRSSSTSRGRSTGEG